MNMNLHSYRSNHSTTSAISQLIDSLFEATDINMVFTFIDQSAAFDNVSHKILLEKFNRYNCSKKTLTWFENYLSFRSQCVAIGSKLSSIKPVNSGVPQGFILGPLLFSVYTNEMPNVLKDAYNCQHMDLDQEYLFGPNSPLVGY